MRTNMQCKTITREKLVEALSPFPEYEVSQRHLNIILPNQYTVSGIDDTIDVFTVASPEKEDPKMYEYNCVLYDALQKRMGTEAANAYYKYGRGKSPFKQTDTPPEGTEVFEDEALFIKTLVNNIEKNRFKQFYHVPEQTMNTVLAFALVIKNDFIQGFRESLNCTHISCINGVPHDGLIPLTDGGYEITEQYSTTYHFTKSQTEWEKRDKENMTSAFREEYQIPEDQDIDSGSKEFEEWEEWWCENYKCCLTVEVTVPCSFDDEVNVEVSVTYGENINEVLIDKLIPLTELDNTSDPATYSMDKHIKLLKIEVEEYEKPYVYFNMAFDGEVAIPEEEYPSIEDCLESVNYSQNTGFYPFQFIKKGDTIVHPPQALGKTVEEVSKFFKELYEFVHDEEDIVDDYEYYLHQLTLNEVYA